MNKLIPSILGLLIFFNSSASLLAESSNHDTGTSNDSSSSSNSRAAQAEPLNDREMNFISNNFFLSKLTIWNKYSEKLPRSLEKAMKNGDETEVGQVIADLMGMVNKKQAERVLENAKKERDSEAAKKPNGGEERYIALMERILWGSKAFLNDPSKEESAEKYNKEFNSAFKTVTAKNEEILEKIKQAADGNEQAKKWLRANLDQSSLLSFAEGQKKYGNGALADRLIDAMSFKEGKNKFLDMSLQSETQRLHLGQTSSTVSTAFDKFLENRQGFNGAVVSLSPFETQPMKQWFVDNSGDFKSGAPSSFNRYQPTLTPPASNIASSNNGQQGSGNSLQSSSNNGSNTSPSVASNSKAADLAKIQRACLACHSSAELTLDANGVLIKDGAQRSRDQIINAINKVSTTMVDHFNSNPAEKNSIISLVRKWIKDPS